ncbi:MAG: hypothetical protein Q9170_002348 [Blastenia crenularia]
MTVSKFYRCGNHIVSTAGLGGNITQPIHMIPAEDPRFKHMITGEMRAMQPPEARGGILSDEMGMGKSLALIALIMHTLDNAHSSKRRHEGDLMREESNRPLRGPTIIVTPKHTSTSLRIYTFHGQGASVDYEDLATYDVVLTSYQTVFSDSIRSKTLMSVWWYRVVLDEAHQIRNRTNAFQAILNLKTERRWCLTGTPVQNRLEDLFTLTEFLQLHPVESRRNARRWILEPLGRREDSALENLRLLMRTVSLRRSRDSEMKHARSELEVAVDLSQSEREQYERVRANAGRMRANMGKAISAHTLLSSILQMRQICSHGLQEKTTAPRLADARVPLSSNIFCTKCFEPLPYTPVLRPSVAKNGEAVFCLECTGEESGNLSLVNDPLPIINAYHSERDNPTSETDTSGAKVADDTIEMDVDATSEDSPKSSSKIQSVIKTLMQLANERNHGSPPTKRQRDSLTSDPLPLNLTAATHVHLVEPQWNPMVEAQAAARVDRLDQEKNVTIVRYVVKNSIEKNITARQRHKLWLAKISMSSEPAAADLQDLCSLID